MEKTSFKTLLPQNASEQERTIDGLAARTLAMDLTGVDTNPRTCPENLLPWLAASWQIDVDGLTIDEQRRLVANALEIHKYRGTVYAVKKALDAVFDDAQIIEFKKPFFFDVKVKPKTDPTAAYGPGKFARARKLVNQAKNLRSRMGNFEVSLPSAALPLNLSALAGVAPKFNSHLAMQATTKANVTGAMQWII